MKTKVSQAQNNWFVFTETPVYKRGVRSIKKEQIFSYLVYNNVSLGNMGGKAEPFSWRSVEDELAVKYLENLDV